MNYYKRSIGAYRKHTARLNLCEVGAYDRLLDEHYATERPLPLDQDELYRVAGAHTADEQKAVQRILREFWVKDETGYTNARAGAEILHYKGVSGVRAIAGKKAKHYPGVPRGTSSNSSSIAPQLTNGSSHNSEFSNSEEEKARTRAKRQNTPESARTCFDCGKHAVRALNGRHYCIEHYKDHYATARAVP